jgi:hypothetical protein
MVPQDNRRRRRFLLPCGRICHLIYHEALESAADRTNEFYDGFDLPEGRQARFHHRLTNFVEERFPGRRFLHKEKRML